MRTFLKHEGKKTPCKKGTFRNEVPDLAGRFLFYSAALIFDMLNAETFAVRRNGCVDFEMVGFLSTIGKLNFLTC